MSSTRPPWPNTAWWCCATSPTPPPARDALKEQINETDYRQFGTELNWSGDSWKLHALAGYSGAEKTLDYANLKHVAYAPSRTRWTADGGETIKSANPASIDMYKQPRALSVRGL